MVHIFFSEEKSYEKVMQWKLDRKHHWTKWVLLMHLKQAIGATAICKLQFEKCKSKIQIQIPILWNLWPTNLGRHHFVKEVAQTNATCAMSCAFDVMFCHFAKPQSFLAEKESKLS